MANILVGDDDCTVQCVVNIFEQSACANIVAENWRRLARSLNTPAVFVSQQNHKLLVNILTRFDVIEELLMEWRSRMSENSTLGELLKIVENELKWNQIAALLREIIKSKAKCWTDLDEHSKSEILNMTIFFQGQPSSLSIIPALVGEEKLDKILCQYFAGGELKTALRMETFSIDTWNVSEKLPYYIERMLKMRNNLNPKIFDEKCSDIFVFEGITHPNLSILVDSEATDVSSNQLEGLTVRFIILEVEMDFKTIKYTARSPIHRIKLESGIFRWTSTIGSTKLIKKFLMDEYEEFSQSDFVMKILSDFNKRPIAIVDTAGMGKSMLLNSIASSIKVVHPERIVLFITTQELIEILGQNLAEDNNLDFQRTIAKAVSSTTLGFQIMSAMMNNINLDFEIFFDGFDEVSQQHLNGLRNFFIKLLTFKNIRAHVTSRPHMQEELEDIFEVVPLNIVAFSEQDQLKFLNDFWNSKFIPGNTERLHEFAPKCLASIQDITKDTHKDIAGIPLQCYILSEVYTNAAQRYADKSNNSDKILTGFQSVLELYTKFVDQRFQTLDADEREILKLAHYYYAYILLFPHSMGMATPLLNIIAHISQSEMFSIGIIRPGKLKGTIEFQHRTFAEYLLAEHLIERVPALFYNQDTCNFLFNEVLMVIKTTHGVLLTDFIAERFSDVFESAFGTKKRTKPFNSLKRILISDPARRFVLDSTYIDRNSLKTLLYYWSYVSDTTPTLHLFLEKLRDNLAWHQIADDLQQLCVKDYHLEFQYGRICYFLNTFLSVTVTHPVCSTEVKIPNYRNLEESSKLFVLQSFVCAARNFSSLFQLLGHWFHNQALDTTIVNTEWPNVLICAAGHDNVEMYNMFCNFLLKVCNKNWYEIGFPNKTIMQMEYAHTPLHETVQKGNYCMTEFLLRYYDIKSLSKAPLFLNCVIATSSASNFIVDCKLKICHLLFEKDKNFLKDVDLNQCLVGVHGVNAKFFKLITVSQMNLDKLISVLIYSVFPFISSNDMDNLVEHLVSNKLVRILFLENKSGLNAIQWCLACDTLKPDMMLHIYKSVPFDFTKLNTKRFDFLDCIFESKWSESWIEKIVENFGINVSFLCRKQRTLLHYAAKHRNVKAIRYLVEAGADVNAKCKRGYTPNQYVLFPNKLDDLELLAECTSLLISR